MIDNKIPQGESKLIMNSNLAVFLLKKGFSIIDLKANRENHMRTVFVFRVENGFSEAMKEYGNLSKEEKRKIQKSYIEEM